ncbi:MAG: tetratricopeptide repeat protein, partial [Acidobacteria bacterium]|nr:tetratricopeptide repeat protein [Acidobacteriota bacterium]
MALLIAGAVPAIAVIFVGAARPQWPLVYGHIAASAVAVLWILGVRIRHVAARAALIAGGAALCAGAWYVREVRWQQSHKIVNPLMPPSSMEGEGDGPSGKFFPSSVQTGDGNYIPAKYFMQSDQCRRCHADIYEQWSGSMHRFSSFNNQWYRKSIEYMQSVNGVQSSKWCAGCHDPALLFTGLMDKPIEEVIDRPEAHAGLGCIMCHSVVSVKSTTGQGDYVMEYPELNDIATSESPTLRALHDFLVKVNPEPHRRTFMKPFVRNQTAEFCSSCHKVHLDVPVNNYRWIRGFNDYDNWQASGVSGQGARSFYYPAKTQKCIDCHMPMVPSQDKGNRDGMVHSHRFPGANTAVPFANQDAAQFEVTEKFLKDNLITVDIFAVSPAREVERGGEMLAGRVALATTFAVGEEAEAGPAGVVRELAPVSAPLDRLTRPAVRAGDTVRVDVVVRTRKIGHFFPGGTVDAFDVWLELIAKDEKDRVIFWSGRVEDDGKGPVEKGAHFYRSLLVDAHGNPINKRNASAARALVYVRLIPPGAADTVHYRLAIPEDAGTKIKLEARLHYRKFAWFNTQFAFAGVPEPPTPENVSRHFDDRKWSFTGDTSKVSGKLKAIPDLPIITLATDETTLDIAERSAPRMEKAQTVLDKADWERWNDYGIGLLLQGDLKGAEAAFTRATEIDPANVDGWVNIGRARVQEGNMDGARQVLEKALSMQSELARANFFYAKVLRSDGRYDDALRHLATVSAQYPRDRVVRNDMGRILFLQRKYREAIKEFEAVLRVDPEDLQAHYNLMLCYNGLGDEERAMEHQERYLRFKADESAQAIT